MGCGMSKQDYEIESLEYKLSKYGCYLDRMERELSAYKTVCNELGIKMGCSIDDNVKSVNSLYRKRKGTPSTPFDIVNDINDVWAVQKDLQWPAISTDKVHESVKEYVHQTDLDSHSIKDILSDTYDHAYAFSKFMTFFNGEYIPRQNKQSPESEKLMFNSVTCDQFISCLKHISEEMKNQNE